MRVRSIIRDMTAGDPAAWDRAEAKLLQDDVRPENKSVLRYAMARLPDPRKPRTESAGYIINGKVVETYRRSAE